MKSIKATNQELLESYSRTRNIWKTAKKFNMCGQSVHERLQKLNVIKNNFFTKEEIEKIKKFYGNSKEEPKNLSIFAQELGRPKTSICRKARKLGLTSLTRKSSKEECIELSARVKNQWKRIEHPRGMLGKTHSKEYREEISNRVRNWWKDASEEVRHNQAIKGLKTKIKKYGHAAPQLEAGKFSWKQGWRFVGGKRLYFRSRWEANYARYLQFLKERQIVLDWEHEQKTFFYENRKQGPVSYLPDFKVIYVDGYYEWHEVKGWYDDRSKQQLMCFAEYFSTEKLIIIDSKWFSENTKALRQFIIDWEL